MYEYPMPINQDYFQPIITPISNHSMQESLFPYLKMKINTAIKFETLKRIKVTGCFDRNINISKNEKTEKLFNYMRPTVLIKDEVIEIKCFPGIDYVFHFSNIYSTFAYLVNSPVEIICDLPCEKDCWDEICNSSLKDIPKTDTVIMGYVEGLEFLSTDKSWNGEGAFLYKKIKIKSGEAILLGCKHTYWGDIAGRIVAFLSTLGVKRVIYCGKLGTLNPYYIPNETIATGNTSLLPNGKSIVWDNLFEKEDNPIIKHGKHITIPSVLQETNQWVEKTKAEFAFVDPEIGHMAYAAQKSKMYFSYLHIVSDNLSKKYFFDLSNERKKEVLLKRRKLINIVGEAISTL